jgi:hypothetical protein
MDLLKAALIGGAASYALVTVVPKILPASTLSSPYSRAAALVALGVLGGYGLHRLGMHEAGVATAAVVGGIGIVTAVGQVMATSAAAPAPAPAALGGGYGMGAVELGSTWQLGAVELGETWQLGAVELGAIEAQMQDAEMYLP